METKTPRAFGLEIDLPKDIQEFQIEAALALMHETLNEIGRDDAALRSYLLSCVMDGYPGCATPEMTTGQLVELCIRAFWWHFSKVAFEQAGQSRELPPTH